jgi:hypothetical protein
MYYNTILQILIGFILADIISGTFHWFEDTYLDYCIDIPIISEIAKDNEMHHYFPRTLLAYSYLENIQISILITLTIIFLLFLILKKSLFKYPYFITSLIFFIINANIFHRFSHMRDCENNYIVILLQKTGILCSHKFHSIHHTKIDEKYCVISEYTNIFLDSIYFWRFLEYIIYLFTNIKPNRKQSYDDYYKIHNYMHENAKLECPDRPTKKDIYELSQKLKLYKKCKK